MNHTLRKANLRSNPSERVFMLAQPPFEYDMPDITATDVEIIRSKYRPFGILLPESEGQ